MKKRLFVFLGLTKIDFDDTEYGILEQDRTTLADINGKTTWFWVKPMKREMSCTSELNCVLYIHLITSRWTCESDSKLFKLDVPSNNFWS